MTVHLCRAEGSGGVGWLTVRGRDVDAVSRLLRVAGVLDGPGRAAIEGLRLSGWSVQIRTMNDEQAHDMEARRAICEIDGGCSPDVALGIAAAEIWG